MQVVAAARSLLKSGVSSVLVTLSERGAVLVDKNGTVTTQSALPVPGGTVVDGTAAGEPLTCSAFHSDEMHYPSHV